MIIEVDPCEANVQLDGQPIEGGFSAKRLSVSAGHHVVEAHIGRRPPIRREVDVLAGGTAGIVLHVVPLSADAIGYDEPQGEAPAPAARDAIRLPLILTGAGVTLVALGLGAGFNLLATSSSNDAVAHQVAIGQAGGTTSSCYAPAAGFARACTALHDDLAARDRNADVAVAAYADGGRRGGGDDCLRHLVAPTGETPEVDLVVTSGTDRRHEHGRLRRCGGVLMRAHFVVLLLVAGVAGGAVALSAACFSEADNCLETDSCGGPDAGGGDTGIHADAGGSQAGNGDGGKEEAGNAEAGNAEAGNAEAGDAASGDAAGEDAASGDAAGEDAAMGDGAVDAGVPLDGDAQDGGADGSSADAG